MNRNSTPRQAFESADCMLVQAATTRHCAGLLQAQIYTLYNEADSLEKSAYTLQYLGMEDRDKLSRFLGRILQDYANIIPQFNATNPGVLEKLSLAVEEGCVLVEQIEAVGSQLHTIANGIEFGVLSTTSSPIEDIVNDVDTVPLENMLEEFDDSSQYVGDKQDTTLVDQDSTALNVSKDGSSGEHHFSAISRQTLLAAQLCSPNLNVTSEGSAIDTRLLQNRHARADRGRCR